MTLISVPPEKETYFVLLCAYHLLKNQNLNYFFWVLKHFLINHVYEKLT